MKFKKLAVAVTSRSSTAPSGSPAHAGLYRKQIAEIEAYAVGHGNLNQAPASTRPR